MKGIRKGLYLAYLLLASILMLSGCGSKERQMGIDGYVYVREEESLLLPANQYYEKLVSRGGYLYYLIGAHTVDRRMLEEGVPAAGFSPIKASGGSFILSFAVDEDMGVYYLLGETTYDRSVPDSVSEVTEFFLVKRLPDGSRAYKTALGSFTGGLEAVEAASLEVNMEKQAFAMVGMNLYGVDAEGELLEGTSLDEYGITSPRFAKLLEGEGGKVYFHNGGRVYSLYEAVAEGGVVRLTAINVTGWPSISTNCDFYGSSYGMLCNESMYRRVYRYHEEDASWQELFRWGDGDERGNVLFMTQVSGDTVAAFLPDAGGVRLFTKTAVSELPEKKILVMANIGAMARDLEIFISKFNRNSTEYHIMVENYGWTQEELTRLDVRLMSSDPPDLLRMDEMDVAKYAQKKVLEDLAPYLESSSLLERGDYLEGVLEDYTISGMLAAIPDEFEMMTLLGRTDEVGTGRSWTAEDIMALAEEYPQYHLMRLDSLEFVYPFFADYVFDRYIDWESGTCDFDSDSFRKFMEWMEKHTEGIEIDYEKRYGADEVLLYDTEILDGGFFCRAYYMFGCEATVMGYPSEGGEMWFPVRTRDTLAIMSKSPYKEAAWEFIEAYLSRGSDMQCHLQLPTKIDLLEEYLEEDLEDGEEKIDLYVNGEPVKWNGATEEEMELLKQYIEAADFTPRGGVRDAISGIVMEEMAVYLNGEKPLEEVSRIIQNRVVNLVQENR